MIDVDLNEDERALLDSVPPGGSTLSNKRARTSLGWDEARYFAARDALVDGGFISRGVGRGGTIFRVLPEASEPEVTVSVPISNTADAANAAVAAAQREESLYEPIRQVLWGVRARDLRSSLLAAEIIARQGWRLTGGTWSRPDLVTIEVLNLLYVPNKILEVVTFEVKPADAIDVQCVYEALAHRRAATRAYVMLHIPKSSQVRLQETLDTVTSAARSHGIGVIHFSEPSDYDTWEEIAPAERIEPAPERLNAFIETQMPDGVKNRLARDLR